MSASHLQSHEYTYNPPAASSKCVYSLEYLIITGVQKHVQVEEPHSRNGSDRSRREVDGGTPGFAI